MFRLPLPTRRREEILPSDPARSERGMTLTELAIVGTLAVLVILGLTGFYYSSQKMWLAASTQAMTQRDASLIVDVLSKLVHSGSEAIVDPPHRVTVFVPNGSGTGSVPIGCVEWQETDRRIHAYGVEDGNLVDRGPIADSRVLRFQLTTVDSTLVELRCLELLSAEGDTIRMASRFAFLSR